MRVWVVIWIWAAGLAAAVTSDWTYEGTTFTLAHLNFSYYNPQTEKNENIKHVGRFAHGAAYASQGALYLGGCTLPWNLDTPGDPWIALSAKGECTDKDKIEKAVSQNASAVIIYTRDTRAHLRHVGLNRGEGAGVGVVYIDEDKGIRVSNVLGQGTHVFVTITRGQPVKYHVTNINRFGSAGSLGRQFVEVNPFCDKRMTFMDCAIVTSVLFVSVSFIILMVISLAWLVFYYVQRFRYIHAKDRLARHLCNAAKKALAKIPVKNLKANDREVTGDNECCAVCIEPYQVSETVRTLPCKHEFHKNCVDPWLLEHRTCPMCKMDILRFYGYVLSESEESVLDLDMIEDSVGVGRGSTSGGGGGGGGGATSTSPAPGSTSPRPQSSQPSQVVIVGESESRETSCHQNNRTRANTPTYTHSTPISPTYTHSTPTYTHNASTLPTPSASKSGKGCVDKMTVVEEKGSAPLGSASVVAPPRRKSSKNLKQSEGNTGAGMHETQQEKKVDTVRDGRGCDVEVCSIYSDDFLATDGIDAVNLATDNLTEDHPSNHPSENLPSIHPSTDRTNIHASTPQAIHSTSPQTLPNIHAETLPSIHQDPSIYSASRKPRATHSPSRRKTARSRSRGRSGSRGRAGRRRESASSETGALSDNVRPTSHIVSVSHV